MNFLKAIPITENIVDALAKRVAGRRKLVFMLPTTASATINLPLPWALPEPTPGTFGLSGSLHTPGFASGTFASSKPLPHRAFWRTDLGPDYTILADSISPSSWPGVLSLQWLELSTAHLWLSTTPIKREDVLHSFLYKSTTALLASSPQDFSTAKFPGFVNWPRSRFPTTTH